MARSSVAVPTPPLLCLSLSLSFFLSLSPSARCMSWSHDLRTERQRVEVSKERHAPAKVSARVERCSHDTSCAKFGAIPACFGYIGARLDRAQPVLASWCQALKLRHVSDGVGLIPFTSQNMSFVPIWCSIFRMFQEGEGRMCFSSRRL